MSRTLSLGNAVIIVCNGENCTVARRILSVTQDDLTELTLEELTGRAREEAHDAGWHSRVEPAHYTSQIKIHDFCPDCSKYMGV